MKKSISIIFLFLVAFGLYAQKNDVEKLIKDADEIETHFNQSHLVAEQKLSLANNLIVRNHLDSLKPFFYLVLSKLKMNLLQKDSAEYYTQLSLNSAIFFKNNLLKTRALFSFGNLQFKKGKFNDAIKYYHQSLKIAEENNFNDRIAFCYKNIGFCHLQIKQYSNALLYYNKALKEFQNIKDSINVSQTILNIGTVYYELNDSKNAIYNFNKSLVLSMALNDSITIAKLYNNIGAIYIDYEKDTLKGLPYLLKAAKIKEDLQDNENLSFAYDNIGAIYAQLKKLDSANFFLGKALQYAQESNSYYDLESVYKSLSILYTYKGNYKQALDYYRLSAQMKDSIINTESIKGIKEIETKFEVEKKDLQLAKNRAEIETQQKQHVIKNIIILGIVIITLLILFVVFSHFKNSKKQQQLKFNSELEIQKQKNEKAVFEAEEKERIRIAQDLHDNMGSYATSILAQIDNVEISPNEIKNEKIKDLRSDAENIMSTLRETIWILKTKTISAQQFFELLKIYADKNLVKNLSIKVTYNEDISTLKYLSPTISLNLYRIIQEVIQNIVKHAKAKNVELTLFSNRRIILQIIDDGIGFDMDDLARKSGLDNIEFRANEINYHIEVKSKPGKGTQLRVEEKT